MNVLFVTAESAPFMKTGGLGDVAYALPKALNIKGTQTRVVMPLYKRVKMNYMDKLEFVCEFTVPLSWRMAYCGVYTCENDGVIYYFLDNEYYFYRDNAYGDFDDGERYAYFSKASLEMLSHIDYYPDVMHINDWQTALVPLFLKAHYSHLEEYQKIKTVFTIHNIEYQGKMSYKVFTDILGVDDSFMQYINFENCVNFMYSAIRLSDRITAVSKTYAEEIQDAYFGNGLEKVLANNSYKLCGIVNGIDTDVFDPQTDPVLPRRYSIKSLHGKAINKVELQKELNLPQDAEIPMVSMVTRLVAHKGIDLVKFVLKEIVDCGVQFVLLGTGDKEYEEFFKEMERQYPNNVKALIMFDATLANKIYAASDILLMPSKSEPCGLAQMIAMRYATVPVVRETGGLKDTVSPYNPETGEGRGFTFKTSNAHDMLAAITRSLDIYCQKDKWKELIKKNMEEDFSWDNSAGEYIELYNSI